MDSRSSRKNEETPPFHKWRSSSNAEDFDDNIPNLNISTTSVLLDELKVFKFSLDEAAVRYLAGISFLDISGNKYHGTPMGVFGAIMLFSQN